MYVLYRLPRLRSMFFSPAVQLVAVMLMVLSIARLINRLPGDDPRLFILFAIVGGLMAVRWVFLALRNIRYLRYRLSH